MYLDLQVQREPVLAFVQRNIARNDAIRQGYGGRFRHAETLLCAAIERQGQFFHIAVRREHLRIAVIPDRSAVRRRRRDGHELQIVRGDRFLHLLAGQFGERQARLMRRPQI